MSIKPVAWMHKDGSVITAEKKKKAERSSSIQGAMVSGYTTPLIPAIPDTHRVVPVELLRRAIGREDRMEMVTAFVEIGAIIEDNRS